MRIWDSEAWQKKLIKLFWEVTDGKPFFYRDLVVSNFGYSDINSLGASVRNLAKFGCLVRIGRGQYDFTDKARNFIGVGKTTPIPLKKPLLVAQTEGPKPFILSPGEMVAFRSIEKGRVESVGLQPDEQNRKNEKDVDFSRLDDGEREEFFRKMKKYGVWRVVADGKPGRILQIDPVIYLELAETVQILSPASRLADEMRPVLIAKEQEIGALEAAVNSLKVRITHDQSEIGGLEREMRELQKKLDAAREKLDAKMKELENIRRQIAAAGGDEAIERLRRKVSGYEAIAQMDEEDQLELLKNLRPETC